MAYIPKVTIASLVKDLPRLKSREPNIIAYEETNPFTPIYPIVDKNTYLGIEVEVENVKTFKGPSLYWDMINDHSLRDNGREFITPPLRAHRVERALNLLFNTLINPDVSFSQRTSIHVHMNIRTLTLQQLQNLILVYLIFENSLFNFISNERDNNIFCVPIYDTNFAKKFKSILTGNIHYLSWEKYTALNLLPIFSKGTIEFRHCHGTKDIKKIMTWINLILSLKKYALQNTQEVIWNKILTLNSNSQYKEFTEEVFKELGNVLYSTNDYKKISNSISMLKTYCLDNDFFMEIKLNIKENSRLLSYMKNTNKFKSRKPKPENSRVIFTQEVLNSLDSIPIPPSDATANVRNSLNRTIRVTADNAFHFP